MHLRFLGFSWCQPPDLASLRDAKGLQGARESCKRRKHPIFFVGRSRIGRRSLQPSGAPNHWGVQEAQFGERCRLSRERRPERTPKAQTFFLPSRRSAWRPSAQRGELRIDRPGAGCPPRVSEAFLIFSSLFVPFFLL